MKGGGQRSMVVNGICIRCAGKTSWGACARQCGRYGMGCRSGVVVNSLSVSGTR